MLCVGVVGCNFAISLPRLIVMKSFRCPLVRDGDDASPLAGPVTGKLKGFSRFPTFPQNNNTEHGVSVHYEVAERRKNCVPRGFVTS